MSKVAKGFFWSAIDHFSVQGLQFVLSIIIARLVAPESYGVVVIVQVFMSFAQVFIDGGFKSALIQKNDRSEIDYYTVFFINMTVAVVLYGVMFVLSPFIASFYVQPQLTDLIRVVALNLIFSSLSITQLVKLQINLDFKKQAKVRVISVLLSGIIGVICAYKGFEAWALVIQSVLCTFLTSILLIVFSRWRPKLLFSKDSFYALFGFGSKVLFSNLLTTLYMQVSNLVIGKFYTPNQLAFYNRAFTFSNVPSVSIVEVMGRIIYPVFCELQNNEDELLDSYRKYLRLVNFFILPIMFFVCVLARPLVLVVLTEKWISTAPLLSILCIAFATYPYQYVTGNFVLSVGRSGLLAKSNILKQSIAFLLLIASLFISVKAVAISLLVSNVFNVFVGVFCVRKVKPVSIRRQFLFVLPIFLISVVSSLVAFALSCIIDGNAMKLLCGFLGGGVTYISLCFFLKVNEFGAIQTLIKKLI